MPELIVDAMSLDADALVSLLAADAGYLPELEAVRSRPGAVADTPQRRAVLAEVDALLESTTPIPETRYSDYRLYIRTGDRDRYQTPYFRKRAILSAAALRLFLGDAGLKDTVQDTIWSVCEETNWVVPAHEAGATIDLFAAETGFLLAEALVLLGETLDAEVRDRVRAEVERRVFTPYLENPEAFHWYRGSHNWNGVCNSSVAATFLLLEPDPARAARAVATALAGLQTFLERAFEEDGASTEGVGYWHYGTMNYVALSEMLRARSGGAIDLLQTEQMRRVAAYPAKVHLSGSLFASFSDCDETVTFNPGILARFALRTGEPSLLSLIAGGGSRSKEFRLPMMLRNLLWHGGAAAVPVPAGDSYLAAASVVRLAAQTPAGVPVVLALKGGHNAEHHNQNDVGSFILHVDGENLLVDPGRGLYDRFYFSGERYKNVFAGSHGHSVPRIGGVEQAAGRQFEGDLGEVNLEGPVKGARLELARAYPIEGLESATRRWLLTESGVLRLHDAFRFSGEPKEVEEAFVTWDEVEVEGATAVVRGERRRLRLTLEAPADARWEVERLEEQSKANHKPGILKRLRATLPAARDTDLRVRMEVEQQR